MAKNHIILRVVGVVGVVVVYALFTSNDMAIHPMIVVLTAIIALISPEVLDKLPFGPSK